MQTDDARIKYDRQQRLLDAGLTAAGRRRRARRRSYDGARAQVQQAPAALSQAQTNLRYTKIISPIDGIVVDKQYDVGQTVAASFQAPTLFQIAQDLTKMQVQADVDQSDIGRVKVGQIARFTVDAYPEEEFRGRISQIRFNAQVNQNVVTYPVIIEVANPEGRLRPKMTANVTIDVATVQQRAARAERRAALQAAAAGRRATKARARAAAARRRCSARWRAAARAAVPPARPRSCRGGRRGARGREDADGLHPRRGQEAQARRDPHRHHRRPLHAGRLRRR